MESEKIKCKTCDSFVLQSTFNKCGGLCMRCFMKGNSGYRPAEISAIKEKGLASFQVRWNKFLEKSIPSSGSEQVDEKTNHYMPIIHASVSGFLRFGEGSFFGQTNIEFLNELKSCTEGALREYILELEAINLELIFATKT